MKNQNKNPPIEFKRHLLDYFFNNLDRLEKVIELIQGYTTRGINMKEFWWMNPEFHPISREDLVAFLNDPEFNLGLDKKLEYLEKYIDFASKYSSSR